jgi:multiple sugar transport system ATP-binding protein
MASISLDHVTKIYPNGFEAVHDLTLAVPDGEFMVLVGPSGCGKTTALRMAAGLENITSGAIRIGERVMNDISPKDRDIAMVFQNYALYPHMTVADNIGHALKMRKLPKQEIKRRVRDAAATLGLTDSLDRKPGQLSGGQRQRVAMGRAIVREPSVFLMDEPLSNLDAKLRVQMRAEVSRIQRRIGVATLYVTHDQTEAMTMGDRVAVLRDGTLQQCDKPQVIYDHPLNLFVAAFIGSPAMNLFQAELSPDSQTLTLGSQQLPLPPDVHLQHPGLNAYAGKTVVVGMRPEDLPAATPDRAGPTLAADVELVEALGSELLLHFRTDATAIHAHEATGTGESEAVLFDGAGSEADGIARVNPRLAVSAGDRINLAVATDRLHFFDPHTEHSIWQ